VSDPTLDLGYAFEEPATVLVTVDDAHPVDNTLTLVVTNRSGAAVQFQNPQGLTPSSELPAWNDQASPLGRVAVWFPWGDAPGDLATVGDSQNVVALSLTGSWAASNRMSDPTLGVYWTLFPLSKSVFLEQSASISFEFSGIVSHVGTGGTLPEQSWLTAQPRVPGYTGAQGQVAVWKDELSAKLTGPAAAAPSAEIALAWETVGVDSCELDPGDFRGLAPSGQQQVTMPAEPSATWTLTAYPHGEGSPIYARATVAAQTGWTDLGPVQGGMPTDDTLLTWIGDRFLAVGAVGDCWTSPDGGSWRKVGAIPSDMVDWGGGLTASGGRAWLFAAEFMSNQPSVYSSTDGASWPLAAAVPWSWADGYKVAAALGSLWAFPDNAVWSSPDGAHWSQHPAPPWSAAKFPPVAAELAGRLWTFSDTLGNPASQFWSTADGATWSPGRAAPWDDQQWMVGVAATRSHAYVATHPEAQGTKSLWQMDADGNWKPVQLPAELMGAAGDALAFAATDALLVVYNGEGRVWTYAPPLGGR
jgi:hypothetical protein